MEISFVEAERFISQCTKALQAPGTAGRLHHLSDRYSSPISDTKFMTNDYNPFKAVLTLCLSFPCLETATPS